MATSKSLNSYPNLLARVREQLTKQAASGAQTGNPKGDMPPEKDPDNQGTAAVPSDPDGDNASKTKLPISHQNEDGTADVLTNLPGQVGSGGSNDVPGSSDTLDGNAKERAATSPTVDLDKIASKIVKAAEAVRTLLGKPATAKAANSSTTGNVPKEKDPTEEVPPKTKKDDVEGVPNSDNENKDKKAADALPAVGTPEFFAKLASSQEAVRAICEIEGGAKLVEDLLVKKAGEDRAQALLDDVFIGYAGLVSAAAKQASEDQDQEAFEQEKAAYAYNLEEQFHALTENASDEEKVAMTKLAETLFPAIDNLQTEVEKYAMAMGAQDQAAMEDIGALEEGAPPEAALPGGEEGQPLPLEQIAQLLAMMVESGEIDQQTAEGILTQLAGDAGGGDLEGEVPIDPAALEGLEGGGAPEGEELPPEALAALAESGALEGELPPEMTEPEKAAAALIASVK